MGSESFDVFRFDLMPLHQDPTKAQPNLKVLITPLLLVLEVCSVKPTYRKSWAGNLLMWTDLALSPTYKVKQWFNGFSELSFRLIQIYIGSPMC